MRGTTFILTTSLLITLTGLASAQPVDPPPGPGEPAPTSPEPEEIAPPVPEPSPARAIDPRVLQLEADLRVELDRGRCELALDLLRRLHTFDPQYQVESAKLTECVARVDAARTAIANPPVPVYQTTVESYRKQVIVADLVSFGLTFAGGVGLIGYFFAAPVIHLAHDNSRGALRSFGLRLIPVGVVIASFGVASASSSCESNAEDGCFGEAAVSVLAGLVSMAVVMGVDWAYAEKSERRQVGVRWVPSVNVTRETTSLGLVASW